MTRREAMLVRVGAVVCMVAATLLHLGIALEAVGDYRSAMVTRENRETARRAREHPHGMAEAVDHGWVERRLGERRIPISRFSVEKGGTIAEFSCEGSVRDMVAFLASCDDAAWPVGFISLSWSSDGAMARVTLRCGHEKE